MEAQAWKTGGCLTAPPGTSARNWESRKARWQAPRGDHRGQRNCREQPQPDSSRRSKRKTLILYTDGSGIEGKIGAAVIANLEEGYAHSQMGDENTSTVYAAELRAIEMALASVVKSTEPWAAPAKNGIVIFADSQAALKALRRPRMPSGQIYLARCLDSIQRLTAQGTRTELRWIPAHQGVVGNEIVDRHAKEAVHSVHRGKESV